MINNDLKDLILKADELRSIINSCSTDYDVRLNKVMDLQNNRKIVSIYKKCSYEKIYTIGLLIAFITWLVMGMVFNLTVINSLIASLISSGVLIITMDCFLTKKIKKLKQEFFKKNKNNTKLSDDDYFEDYCDKFDMKASFVQESEYYKKNDEVALYINKLNKAYEEYTSCIDKIESENSVVEEDNTDIKNKDEKHKVLVKRM